MHVNTSYPGRIVSFDEETQTAVVKPMMERYFSDLDKNYQVIPVENLVDVPCHFPKGGGHSITLPIKAGDDCMLFFAHKGIDHWLYDGKEETGGLLGRPSPQHLRSNCKSDAVALIGFGSGILADTPNTIQDFNNNAVELRNEDRTQRISLIVDTKDIEIESSNNLSVSAKDITITASGVLTLTGQTININ